MKYKVIKVFILLKLFNIYCFIPQDIIVDNVQNKTVKNSISVNKRNILYDTESFQEEEYLDDVIKIKPRGKCFKQVKSQMCFKSYKIPKRIFKIIEKHYLNDNNFLKIKNLRYLTLIHYDFKMKIRFGEIIVHKTVANEVLEIFKDLFNKKYKIEKIRLIDFYDSNDLKCTVENNTYGLSYNFKKNSDFSYMKSLGFVISINPFFNPCVNFENKNGKRIFKIVPPYLDKYANRILDTSGMIKFNDDCYKAFIMRGWNWGGDFGSYNYFYKFPEISPSK